jgi:hypothetical protein
MSNTGKSTRVIHGSIIVVVAAFGCRLTESDVVTRPIDASGTGGVTQTSLIISPSKWDSNTDPSTQGFSEDTNVGEIKDGIDGSTETTETGKIAD